MVMARAKGETGSGMGAASDGMPEDGFRCLSRGQVAALERVMLRLYSERRMTGDDMRDAAQTIQGVLDGSFVLEDGDG